MDDIKKLAKQVAGYVKGDKTKSYDTSATVTKVTDNAIYVHIPGGVPETPVKKTIDAKVGDTVQVHVGNGTAWLVGNQTAPPTDDAEALVAKAVAKVADQNAAKAKTTADEAMDDASRAKAAADSAEASATSAQASAENASEYASRALGNLSTVQSVTETLTWITQHGTMTLTSDQHLDPTHVYFVVDAGGDYVVGGTHYSIVTEPDEDDISTYYELSINESLNNYVGTHLALDGEGLWLLPATSGTNKVLIATGAGSTYTTAGTYLIDGSGNISASFRADGATMSAQGVQIAHLGYGAGVDEDGNPLDAPYYDIGVRKSGTTKGNYSIAEGWDTTASGYVSHAEGKNATASESCSHAEGFSTTASGLCSHAEGIDTTSSGSNSHAEGTTSEAAGANSHAQNFSTIAGYTNQTAIGKYNDNKSANAFEIGNGTSSNARSNAFEVAWTGDTKAYGDIEDGSGNVLSDKADTTAIPTATSDLTNDSGFISSDSSGDVTISGKATLGAINGDSLFAYTSISVTTSSIAANASGEATSSASTLANHYPLAITDVNISTGVASLRRFYFSTQQTGRAVVKIGVQNDGTSAKTISATAKILWVKIAV